MNSLITETDGGFLWQRANEQVWVLPWGRNGVRVRVTKEARFQDLPQGLLPNPEDAGRLDRHPRWHTMPRWCTAGSP
jgi:hypothetical protein